MLPHRAAPYTQTLDHPPSEGILRDPAQLPGCCGKGPRESWVVQETERSPHPQEDPGLCERRQRRGT